MCQSNPTSIHYELFSTGRVEMGIAAWAVFLTCSGQCTVAMPRLNIEVALPTHPYVWRSIIEGLFTRVWSTAAVCRFLLEFHFWLFGLVVFTTVSAYQRERFLESGKKL
jgi:hypothetical protein